MSAFSAASDADARRAEAAVAMTGAIGSVVFANDQLQAFETLSPTKAFDSILPETIDAGPTPQEQPLVDAPALISSANPVAGMDDVPTVSAEAEIVAQPATADQVADGLPAGIMQPASAEAAAPVPFTSSDSLPLDILSLLPPQDPLVGPNVLNSLTTTLSIGDGASPSNLTYLLGGLDPGGLVSDGSGLGLADGLLDGRFSSLAGPVAAILSDTLPVAVDVISGATDFVGSLLSATPLAPIGELVEGLGETLSGLLGSIAGTPLSTSEGENAGLLDGVLGGLLPGLVGGSASESEGVGGGLLNGLLGNVVPDLLGGVSGNGDGAPIVGGLLDGLPLLGGIPGGAGSGLAGVLATGPDSLVGDVLGLTSVGDTASASPDLLHQVVDTVGDVTGLLDLGGILDQHHGLPLFGGHVS